MAAELLGHNVGAGPAVVHRNVLVAAVVVEEVVIELLALLHTAHGVAGDERDAQSLRAVKPGLFQGLLQGNTPQ